MGFYLPGNFIGTIISALITIVPIAVKSAIAILAIILLIKGIKYLDKKNKEDKR